MKQEKKITAEICMRCAEGSTEIDMEVTEKEYQFLLKIEHNFDNMKDKLGDDPPILCITQSLKDKI